MLTNGLDLVAVLMVAASCFAWGWWLSRSDTRITQAQLKVAHDEVRRLRQELADRGRL